MNTNQANQTNVTVLTDENGVQREYAEVKRKANVGDRVKIILSDAGMKPRKGDVLKIVRANEHDELVYGEAQSTCMRSDNYVVLEPTSTVIIDGVRYREEKRKAAVGERILIVDSCDSRWNNGEVFTVGHSQSGGVLVPHEKGKNEAHPKHAYALDEEYVVLTLIDEPATSETSAPVPISITINVTVASMDVAVQTVADAVKAELAKVQRKSTDELCMSVAESLAKVTAPKPKTPQELRDEIVERAKADVEELRMRAKNHKMDTPATKSFGDLNVEFAINRDKRTVVALLRDHWTRSTKVRAKGVAKCAPGDVFNSHIGRAIALRRALGLEVPGEYLAIPQPTEVRVGDVVRGKRHGLLRTLTERLEKYDSEGHGKAFRLNNGTWLGTEQFDVIDDSREEVSA